MPVNRINVSVDYIFLKYENYCFDVQFFLKKQKSFQIYVKIIEIFPFLSHHGSASATALRCISRNFISRT